MAPEKNKNKIENTEKRKKRESCIKKYGYDIFKKMIYNFNLFIKQKRFFFKSRYFM